MATQVNIPQKKQDEFSQVLPTAARIVGSKFGPVASEGAGMVAEGVTQEQPGFQALSAPKRRMAMGQLEQGRRAAVDAGDNESLNIIDQALAMSKQTQMGSDISSDAIKRRKQQGVS